MKKIFLLLTLLFACTADINTTSQYLGTQGSVFDVANYGAIPDDGIDDRVQAQSAIDAACAAGGGEVRFGPGTWDLTRAPLGSYNRFAALAWHCANVSIKGAGEYLTTLKMSGDQGASTTFVLSMDPGASGSRISDLAIDTVDTFNTEEHFHGIAIGTGVGSSVTAPPVTDITVERVRINHPVVSGVRKGDCINVFGNYPNTEARNIKLLDLNLYACARSGIMLQRNANDVLVRGCTFYGDNIGATQFDGEATGGGWDKGLIVDHNFFLRSLPGGDLYALTLTSQTHWSVSNNIFFGRGIFAYRTNDGRIVNNTFDGLDQSPSTGLIETGNVTDRIVIDSNNLRRHTGSTGFGIKLQPHSGGIPTNITISNNQIWLDMDGSGIYVHSGKNMSIANNTIECAPTANTNSIGVYLSPISQTMTNISVTGNNIENCAFAAMRFPTTATYAYRALTVGLNTSMTSGPVKCENWSLNPGQVVSGLNNWSQSSACASIP